MPLKIVKGNIFSSETQVIVNTVNCVGVMGAGIALECRLRYPDMHEKYIEICDKNLLQPGLLWIYKSEKRWILNFPTKKHWKNPSKEIYLRDGLSKFVESYKFKNITSIAFPLLGADKGGFSKDTSLSIMKEYLSELDINIEIYEYDPFAYDEIFIELKKWLLSEDILNLSRLTKIRANYLENIIEAIKNKNICQVNQLANVRGVGLNTLEKLFAIKPETTKNLQAPLF